VGRNQALLQYRDLPSSDDFVSKVQFIKISYLAFAAVEKKTAGLWRILDGLFGYSHPSDLKDLKEDLPGFSLASSALIVSHKNDL